MPVQWKDTLENQQIPLYLVTIVAALLLAMLVPGTTALAPLILPALALMLFVTFLQVPIAELGRAFTNLRFLVALLTTNFVLVPLLVALMLPFMPAEPLLRLGILLVLLTPCIDYVVTFSHLGRADARLLLAATPVLLIMQFLLLPVYLKLFLGDNAAGLIHIGPFIESFLGLIVVPLVLAGLVQLWSSRQPIGQRVNGALSWLPVPATALVLFIIIATIWPQLSKATDTALTVLPFYIAFALIAPLLGWFVSRLLRLETGAARAVTFSGATRNSLVILPLVLAIPGAMPLLPAIVVTQTLVELLSELIYVRLIPKLIKMPT